MAASSTGRGKRAGGSWQGLNLRVCFCIQLNFLLGQKPYSKWLKKKIEFIKELRIKKHQVWLDLGAQTWWQALFLFPVFLYVDFMFSKVAKMISSSSELSNSFIFGERDGIYLNHFRIRPEVHSD